MGDDQTAARLMETLRAIIAEHCTCGGRQPGDPLSCQACRIWQTFMLRAWK